MGINKQSDIAANLQIGPTSLGMVRIYVEAEGVDLPLDFDPDEAEEIAEEWIGTRKTQDWKLAKTVNGRAEQPTLEEGPIVPPEHLADRLGVADNKVHALLVGLKRIYRLEWPMTVWTKRR